jgi:hypothetical protein
MRSHIALYDPVGKEAEEDGRRSGPYSLPVAGEGVTLFGGGGPEIFENVNANRAGAAAGMALLFNPPNKLAQINLLTNANFPQRIPYFGFQTHTGASAVSGDVTIN